MPHNGPAVQFRKRYSTKHPGRVLWPAIAGPESCHGARRVWRIFCHPGTGFCGLYECRGTNYLTNGELSRYCYFVNNCGAVRICQALRSCL